MEIIFTVTESTLVAELLGELDHHAAEGTREKIDKAMDNYKVNGLIMDFKKVSFMDSSGIGLILGRYKKAQLWHGEVVLQNLSEPLEKVVRLSGVAGLCRIEKTQEEEEENP